jgi:alpha-glucosidase
MYIPRGKWYDFWNNELIDGEQEVWVDADLDSMPVFVKEGAIIPKYPIQQYVGEKEILQLKLDVYYKEGKEKSEVYEDAHDGYDYKKGRFSLRNFSLIGKKESLVIQQFKSGKYNTPYETFEIKLIGLPFKINKIEIDNENFDIVNITSHNTMVIPKEFTEIHIIGNKELLIK